MTSLKTSKLTTNICVTNIIFVKNFRITTFLTVTYWNLYVFKKKNM